jgi:hypothetical protein
MYSKSGDEFNFVRGGTGTGFNATTFGAWRVTDHATQSVIAERSETGDYSVGAVACHVDHGRFDDYRTKGINRCVDVLRRKGIVVSLAEICKEGDLEVFGGASLPRDARASKTPPMDTSEASDDGEQSLHATDDKVPPFLVGDRVNVYSTSSGGWHPGEVTKVTMAAGATPGTVRHSIEVTYDVDGEVRRKTVMWTRGSDALIPL